MIAALAALAGGGDAPPIDPDDARRAADEILGDGSYAEPTQSLLDRALEWIFDQLGSAFGTLSGGGPGSGMAWVVVAVLGLAAVWLVVRALRVPRVGRKRAESTLDYGTETAHDARVWLDEAERLAAAGDHRGALRCRHQALVARLVTDRIVSDTAGRTAGEHRRDAESVLPHEAPRLARLTDRFDAVWYGGAAVDRAMFDAFHSDCALVEEAAGAHTSAAVAT